MFTQCFIFFMFSGRTIGFSSRAGQGGVVHSSSSPYGAERERSYIESRRPKNDR